MNPSPTPRASGLRRVIVAVAVAGSLIAPAAVAVPGWVHASAPAATSAPSLPQGPPLTGRQAANARIIIGVGKDLNMPPAAWTLAVATGLAESDLYVYANSNIPASLQQPHDAVGADHEALGVFQDQLFTESGPGGVGNLMSTANEARSFYALLAATPGWQAMPAATAISMVQRSAPQVETIFNGYLHMAASIVAANADAPALPDAPTGGLGH